MLKKNLLGIFVLCALGLSLIAMPAAPSQAEGELSGIWQFEGYGYVADISPTQFNLYQVTEVSCVLAMSTADVVYTPTEVQLTNVSGIATILGALNLDVTYVDGVANFNLGIDVAPLVANRIPALPEVCETGFTTTDDPEAIFETVWHLFNEQYAFFDLYDVDWEAQYDTYRPQVTAETDQAALFAILSDMLAPLEDHHLNLVSTVGHFKPGRTVDWATAGDTNDFIMLTLNYLQDEPLVLANEALIYGHLSDSVAYLNILTMMIESETPYETLTAAMDEVMVDLADMDALVLDVRLNGGGADLITMAIAGYFTPESRAGFSKQTWLGNEFGPLTDVMLEPQTATPFEKPVILLTSGMSVSAAEIFAMVMRQLPQVTVIGEPTAGSFSDILISPLPNGWVMTLSNERFLDADGVAWESLGVPPDVDVPMTVEAITAGTDPILEAAMDMLAGEITN